MFSQTHDAHLSYELHPRQAHLARRRFPVDEESPGQARFDVPVFGSAAA